jgi:putative SOS response-associated peptidase YedK
MLVILPERYWAAWLDAGPQGAAPLALLRPFPPDAMRTYPVGPLVNNPQNDGPGCVAPAQWMAAAGVSLK